MTPRFYLGACFLCVSMSCDGSVSPGSGDGDGDGDTSPGDGDGDLSHTGGSFGTGGAATGGAAATGGRTATGGSATTGGNGNSPGGMGGTDLGMGGDMGLGGDGAGGTYVVPADAVPSAGCSLPDASPEDITVDNGVLHVSVPDGYDGSTPLPIVIGFGATGGQLSDILTSAELPATTSTLARDYVIVRARASQAPNSTWEGLEVDAFDEVYQAVEASVCFDSARVFGVGNEGGGRYLIKHVCEDAPDGMVGPNIFRALALVGFQTLPCDGWPALPLVFLHSTETDAAGSDPDGQLALGRFREAMSCGDTTTSAGTWPTPVPGRGDTEGFTYECADWDDCSSPLRFCSWDRPIDASDIWIPQHNDHLSRFFAEYQ